MKRKQKVAVVVGVVVIVLLVLFPPWRLGDGDGNSGFDFPGWSYEYGHAWIGSPPENPFRNHIAKTTETLRTERPDLTATIRQALDAAPPVTVAWGGLVAHLLAALALTVAAVVVLKERKAGA